MIKMQSKYIKFLIPAVIIFVSSLIVLTLSFKNNDLHKLYTVSKEVSSLNKDLGSAFDNDEFDFNASITILKTNLAELEKLNIFLNNIDVKNKNNDLKNQLSSYIKSNITLYEASLSMLNINNPNKFSIIYNNLLKAEQKILLETDNLKNNGLDINFPRESNIFFIKLNKYANDSFKNNRESDIIYSQKQDFLLDINLLLSDFSYLKEDLQPALNNIKENQRDLSILLSDINTKRSKYLGAKEKSYSMVLPQGTHDCHSSLVEMLNSYEVYLNSIEKSIQYDINNSNSNDNKTTKIIQNYYKDSFDKYSIFLSCYDDLKNDIKIYKQY